MGRVDSLLKVQDVTEIHTKALSEDAKREIQEVLRKHGSEILQMDNPTMTMEELFLDKIRESEARPGMKSGS